MEAYDEAFEESFISNFLTSAAETANENFPKMVDPDTRLDKTVGLALNKTFQFHYTFINYTKDELNIEGLKNEIHPLMLNDVITNPAYKLFRDFGVTMEYVYHDKNGHEVLKLTYSAFQYQNDW